MKNKTYKTVKLPSKNSFENCTKVVAERSVKCLNMTYVFCLLKNIFMNDRKLVLHFQVRQLHYLGD